jgi:hypothetical protein
MLRLLLLASLLTIVGSLVSRWWFGRRVLTAEGKRPCRVDQIRWDTYMGKEPLLEVNEAPAVELGKVLRLVALADWKTRDPKRAKARESARRIGMIVPPFGVIIAVFVVFRMGTYAGAVVFLGATALAVITNLLTIGTELTAVAIANRRLRESRSFARRDDEEAVARCSIAHVWDQAIPPILRFF